MLFAYLHVTLQLCYTALCIYSSSDGAEIYFSLCNTGMDPHNFLDLKSHQEMPLLMLTDGI